MGLDPRSDNKAHCQTVSFDDPWLDLRSSKAYYQTLFFDEEILLSTWI